MTVYEYCNCKSCLVFYKKVKTVSYFKIKPIPIFFKELKITNIH